MKWIFIFTIAVSLAVVFYLGFRTINLFNLQHSGYFNGISKKIFWAILFLGIFSFFLTRIIHPISDYWYPLTGNLLLALIICFIYSLVIIDFIRLIMWACFNKSGTSLTLQMSFVGLGFLFFGIGLYMASVPKATHYEVLINKESKIKNIKVVQLSDIHISETTPRFLLENMVEKVNKLNPDYILITGDTLDMYLKPFVKNKFDEVFAELKSKYGTFVIFGNHEHYGTTKGADNSDIDIVNAFKSAKLNVLKDDIFYDDKTGIYIIGKEDYAAESLGKQRKSLQELLSSVDIKKPVILLNHQPKELGIAKNLGVDLMYYGHTHAGQVFPINLVVNLMYENAWGIYQSDDKTFTSIVSCGYGLWGPPIRLMTRAEFTVTDIKFK